MIPVPRLGLVAALALSLVGAGSVAANAATDPGTATANRVSVSTAADLDLGSTDLAMLRGQRHLTDRWVRDTWRSMTAMVAPQTGLPADNIDGDLAASSRSRYTSPTNVASYIWSAISARRLRVIDDREQNRRIGAALDSLARLERHADSGMFFNWYDPTNLELLRVWPPTGTTVEPFVSSVDNAWLAASLMMVKNSIPALKAKASAVLSPMDFAFYYDPNARGADVPAGLMRGGFWVEKPSGCSVEGNYPGRGTPVFYTCHHYGAFNSETRMIGYVAISLGQVPAAHYFAAWRTFPDNCDWSWQEMKPTGQTRDYLGVSVYEGVYEYQGLKFVPTWGGDMFEALMANQFVPEETWGPKSWGRNHPVYVRGQIAHGLIDAKYGHWGFSPASDPFAEYREYGVDAMGLDSAGYASDKERTSVDYGFAGCRDAQPEPASYGDGVVTPHAVFLAMRFAPQAALTELAKLRADFDIYGPGGFYDSVAVRSGTVARRYLALDQGMIMASLGNLLGDDVLREAFTAGGPRRLLRPAMAQEEFSLPERQ